VVRGWVPIWGALVAVAVLVAGAGPGRAQPRPAGRGPVPARPVAAPLPTDPLPTDGLMAPAPPVPPQSSYQRPELPPGTPPPDPVAPGLTLPEGTAIPVPQSGSRRFSFGSRYGRGINITSELLADQVTRRYVLTGGVIVNVGTPDGRQDVEFATDDAVVWVRGVPVENLLGGFQTESGTHQEVEVFLSGNVLIRTRSSGGGVLGRGAVVTQTLRADQVYYDVERNRAVALAADLELSAPSVPDGVHLRGREVHRLGLGEWEVLEAAAFSSKLPSDPGLALNSARVTLVEREVVRRNIFGLPYRDIRTGEPVVGLERILTTRNVVTRLEDVPVFYMPYLRVDATDPLGPLVGLGFGQDRIFGTQIYSTWDVYKLLALRGPEGHKWRLHVDYLSDRGPGLGTDYNYVLPSSEPGMPPPGRGFARLYGVSDGGVDVLGGYRGPGQPVNPPPTLRGRALWRHQQEVLEGTYFQGQIAAVSDQNFLEQYYKNEWDFGPNQETFAYLTWQRQNLWASGLVMPKLGRNWVSQTEWLPRVDGALIGQSFWDLFVYEARANAAYAQSRPSQVYPFAVLPTDRRIDTGRFNLGQELSLPFDLGPLKLAPYGTLDLTYYTQDLTGEQRGRVYGGGGSRASLPLSRLYEDAYSELFNVRGLYHKVMVGANWYYARSDTRFTQLPLLDRLDDDAVDQAYRYITPLQPDFVSGPAGLLLRDSGYMTTPNSIFNPQLYAIRRLVDNRIDTLDSIQVVQADVRQRLQTKRGYPGLEHTVDVITLDLSASYFPEANRDNFGKPFAFLEYGFLWNVGDRVAVTSSGWFDPFDEGARYYNVGAYLNRPDRTSFYLGYRQTDPLNSKAVIGSVGYQLSRRYYANVGVAYDFGIQQALTNSFTLTRTGSDLTVTLGFTYNALVNNFGVQFLVIPNLVASSGPGRFAGTHLFNRP
jgi:hypothetical protein